MTIETSQSAPGVDDKGIVNIMADIARALVDDPEAVIIESHRDADTIVLRLHVAASDVGKVIGKQGRTARSLRTILSAASMKLKQRFTLDIVEEDRAPRDH